MAIRYYLTDKQGYYVAKFFEEDDYRNILFTKSLNRISKELGLGKFDNIVNDTKVQYSKADYLCKEYIRLGLAEQSRCDESIVDFCLEFWNYDGERITLQNQKKPNSISRNSAYNQLLNFKNHIQPNLKNANTPVSKITSKDINDIQDKLIKSGKISNATIKKAIQSITVPVNWYIKKHPECKASIITVDSIDSKPQKERGILTPLQVAKVMKEFAREEQCENLDPCVRLAVVVAALTAMRMGEIQALTVEQITIINEEESVITINQALADRDGFKCPKGKKQRQTIIPTIVAKALIERAYKNPKFRKGDHHIMWSIHSKRHIYSDTYIRMHFYHALEIACGINDEERRKQNIVFHSLRHGFITYLRGEVEDGIFRKAIGHENEKTTDIYTHINYDNLKKISDKANKTFSEVIEQIEEG